MKKLWIIVIIGIVILIPIIGYIISTVTNVVEVDEASPLDVKQVQPLEVKQVKDAMDTMDAATKAEFEKQTNEMKEIVVEMNSEIPSSPSITAQGNFNARANEVKGKALLIDANGKQILRFEDFETINGPKLHIYLSSELGNDDFIDLGEIKATKGNVNYDVPSGTDVGKYNKVLVWCKPFGVLFSYAEIS